MKNVRTKKEANELFKQVFERVAKGELPGTVCRELNVSTSGYYLRKRNGFLDTISVKQKQVKRPTLVNIEVPVTDPIVEVTTIRLPLSQVGKLFGGVR